MDDENERKNAINRRGETERKRGKNERKIMIGTDFWNGVWDSKFNNKIFMMFVSTSLVAVFSNQIKLHGPISFIRQTHGTA